MYVNNKLLIKLFIVLAVVFTTACNDNDNKEKIEILKIDGVWIDSVPEDTISVPNEFPTRHCNGVQNYLLIPSSVQKDTDINIKLYGCWDNENQIIENDIFHLFKSDISNNKVLLTVLKETSDKGFDTDDALDFFKLRKEYNITNNFEIGNIDIVIKTPNDNEELTYSISIE